MSLPTFGRRGAMVAGGVDDEALARTGDPAFGRVAANSAWLVGANGLVYALAFVQGVVLARNLGPAGLGLLALVVSLVTIVQQLLGSRVWEAATTFVVEFRAAGDPGRATAVAKLCYLVDATGGVLACLLLWALAAPAAERILGVPAAADAIRLYAASTILAAPVATASALLRVSDRFRWLAVEAVGESLLRLLAIVSVIVMSGPALRPVLGAYLLTTAVAAIAFLGLGHRAGRDLGFLRWRDAPLSLLRAERRRIGGFLLYSNLSATARLVTGRLDVLIVGWLTTPRSVGLYRLARTLSDPMVGLATPVYHAVYPQVARLVHERDLLGVRRLTRRVRDVGLLATLPVCLLTVVLAPWLVPVVFGHAYAQSVPLIQIMVWQLVWVPYLWVPGLLLSLGRARLLASFTAADAACYVALLLVLVPAFGATGAAWATMLRFLGWTLAAASIARNVDAEMERSWA